MCCFLVQKTSASILEDLSFSVIDLLRRHCRRGREENFLILIIWVVLVDTHLYPAIWRCPDAKTDEDGKDLFIVAQAVHSHSGSKDRFLL